MNKRDLAIIRRAYAQGWSDCNVGYPPNTVTKDKDYARIILDGADVRSHTELVQEFQALFCPDMNESGGPTLRGSKLALLRTQAMIEEVGEFALAAGNLNLAEVLDALVDLEYFLHGTILAYGLQHVFDAAFREVHRANMSKLHNGEVVHNEAGRVVKPEGFVPPNLHPILYEGSQ